MSKVNWILGFLLGKPRTVSCLIYAGILLATLSCGHFFDGDQTKGALGACFADPDAMQQEFEMTWRKTRFGWDDLSKWSRPPVIAFERRIELIHPFAFAGMILTSSLCMMIWASEEWQTERLPGVEALKKKKAQKNLQSNDK